jgi:hypothetical protein
LLIEARASMQDISDARASKMPIIALTLGEQNSK